MVVNSLIARDGAALWRDLRANRRPRCKSAGRASSRIIYRASMVRGLKPPPHISASQQPAAMYGVVISPREYLRQGRETIMEDLPQNNGIVR